MTIPLHLSTSLILATVLLSSCGGGSGGGGNSSNPAPTGTTQGEWLIPQNQVVDGGPGQDGIPPLERPEFEPAAKIQTVLNEDLVIAVRYGDQIRVYPHDIMDWHEIVNEGTADDPYTLSYCPLTGSAMAWSGTSTNVNPSFGGSGLLYNSNLILYDRETKSLWSQMLQQSVNGARIRDIAEQFPVIQTSFSTLLELYPEAVVMTRNTGFSRNYDNYPYGSYKTNADLLFPVNNLDNRLHPKARVVGIHSDIAQRVYQISGFGPSTSAINDQVGDQSIVVIGNTALDFAAIYDRTMDDGTVLNFTAIENDLPNVLLDDEGNVWDIFGRAVSGPRAGAQLQQAESYTAYWFAWASFFPNSDIYFNPT